MPTPSWRAEAAAGLLALLVMAGGPARAHDDAHGSAAGGAHAAVPDDDGWRLGAELALQWADANGRYPLASRPGVLLQGSAPREQRRRLALDHAMLALGARRAAATAVLALGAHDGDEPHVEAASVQLEGAAGEGLWRVALGRDTVGFGPVIDSAGHGGPFAQRPLALHAATDGAWIDDGLRAAWQAESDEGSGPALRGAELGLWRGRVFPGGPAGPAAPTLHLHLGWGEAQLHLGAARLQPRARGAAVALAGQEGHLHGPPDCREGLAQKVCFDGRVQLWLASLSWRPEGGAWRPLGLALGAVRRAEDGLLYATGGEATLRSRLDGVWVDSTWQPAGPWTLALRVERLASRHHLAGTGTALLAREAGLAGAAPARRATLAIGHGWSTGALGRFRLSLEAGHEQQAGTTTRRHVALRLLWQADELAGGSW
jgi:hypothetical protein